VGPGDDGIAINAQNGGGTAGNMVDTKILNNTSIGVTWANGMRVAGGSNSILRNNLITDPADGNGIRVGKFGILGNDCESVLVADNLILRGCGIRATYGQGGISVTDTATATIQSNTIIDSHRLGIDVQRCNATFTGNVIINPGTQGILIKSGSRGSGTFTGNTVSNLKSGMVAFRNDAPSTFTVSSWGNSWQPNAIENKFSVENKSIIYLTNNQNTLNIKDVTGSINVQIFNISGQIILSTLSNGQVDISRLVSGIYVISIENHKPQRFVKK
jgi:parallel beta-helix repeat protein